VILLIFAAYNFPIVTVSQVFVASGFNMTVIYSVNMHCLCNNTHFTAIFQENPGKLLAECHHSGFYWSKDDGGDGDI